MDVGDNPHFIKRFWSIAGEKPPGNDIIICYLIRKKGRGKISPAQREAPSRSAGLLTPRPPRLSTWVYIIVVLTSRCPRSSWTVRMSYPASRRWVAKACRKLWQLAGLGMLALRTAAYTARCKTSLWIWCCRTMSVRGSRDIWAAGKTYSHFRQPSKNGHSRCP